MRSFTYSSKVTHFKLIIDSGLERFRGCVCGGGGLLEMLKNVACSNNAMSLPLKISVLATTCSKTYLQTGEMCNDVGECL